MSVDLRVGIVSWNTAELLDRCLSCLPSATEGVRAEVVVVDNASADGSSDVAAAYPGVQVIRSQENVGYARAMNCALAQTDAPALVALNPDTAPPPGSLSRLAAVLRARPDVGLVAPRLMNADGSLQHSSYRFHSVRLAAILGFVPHRLRRGALGRRWWLEGGAPHDQVAEVDWTVGAVHCIRAAAVAGRRPYSERWFMYAEDTELCWRLHRAGWKVLLYPSVEVPHVGNAAGAAAWRDWSDRETRMLSSTFDWYETERGPFGARAWAATNLLASLTKAAVVGGGAGGSREARAEKLSRLRRLSVVHGRALVRGQAG